MVYSRELHHIILIEQGSCLRIPAIKVVCLIYPSAIIITGILFILLALLAYLYFREVNRRADFQQQALQRETDLKELHQEREWLLREINHRVKNNLQIMISLLNSQEFFLQNPDALGAIKNSQRRLHAISLAYQKVYEPSNPSEIDMEMYIKELIDYLQDEYNFDKDIHCNIEVSRTWLPISAAVPIGLIINEAVSNSFKHAFPKHVDGKIEIKFICITENGVCKLSISDNGIGLPENFEAEEISSLGTSLMMGLSRQLRGDIQLSSDNGVSVSVNFSNLKSDNDHTS